MSFDFSDVKPFFDGDEEAVRKKTAGVGEEAVDYAVAHGNYQDRTGTLRKSNEYTATREGLTLFNGAAAPDGYQYASNVEGLGYEVLSGAALFAEKRLKEEFE